MTVRSIDDGALRQSTFFRTVVDVAGRHRLRCAVALSPRVSDAPYAAAKVLTRRIIVSRAALAETDEEQAWSAAHEVGHLVDARAQGLLRYLPWGFGGWLLLGGSVAGFGPAMVITALKPVLPSASALSWGVGVGSLVLGLVVLAGCLHLALLSLASHQRPQEDSADTFAKSQGYPVTRVIADMLDRHEQRPDGRPQSRRWRRYRRHRDPFERINDDT